MQENTMHSETKPAETDTNVRVHSYVQKIQRQRSYAFSNSNPISIHETEMNAYTEKHQKH